MNSRLQGLLCSPFLLDVFYALKTSFLSLTEAPIITFNVVFLSAYLDISSGKFLWHSYTIVISGSFLVDHESLVIF